MHIYIDGILGDDEISDDLISDRNLEKIRKQTRLGAISEDADGSATWKSLPGSFYVNSIHHLSKSVISKEY